MSSVERMRSLADRIKNPRIAGLLRDALACVTERRHPDFRGLFGETGELIVCALSHAIGADASWLATGEHVYRSLENVYLQQARGADEATLRDCISFCTYGVLVGVYDREDFRYLVRISLSTRRDSTAIERHVRSAIVFLSAASEEQPRPFLSRVREWIDYTGISLCLPSDLAEEARSAGIDIDSVLQEEDFRLVSTLVRHPAYVDEATEGRRYVDLRQATQEWLPDSLSSEVLASCLRRAYSNAQREITSEDSVEDAIDKVEGVFIREGISSGPGSVLPINLHRLPAPPAIELSNTIVLELVPDRLRKSLLGSVVYSRKTRRIEVFFLAGTEIGRSGILVRTDTACILMDYGLSVANLRVPRWIPEIEMVDCVLVSHAHLDHVGGLPILYETYRGNWCSVGLTGPISSILLDDAMRVGMPTSSGRIPPEEPVRGVSAASLRRVMDSHVSLEYGKTAELAGGIMVTPIPASHIPGSAGFIIDIEGVRILYTGDFNAERSALFEGASLPTDCDLTIYDGTYWQREDFDRDRAAGQIAEVIADHGPVIIPSFAV
ncbi:MAG: MBL fold metallo-hydrolase, partial [Candidatus Thorarchaeota archaeon]